MLYIVANADYEEYNPYYVEGPEVSDWVGFCQSLLVEAAERAVQQKGWTDERFPAPDEDCSTWIGCHEVVDALIHVLYGRGYRRAFPCGFCLTGSGIIRDESDLRGDDCDTIAIRPALDKIAAHNKVVEEKE